MSKNPAQQAKAAWISFQDVCSDPVQCLQNQPTFTVAQTAWQIRVAPIGIDGFTPRFVEEI